MMNRFLSLKIPVADAFIPLAAAFVGHAATGLGLDREASDELSLAAEEVFAYIAGMAPDDHDVEIRCFAGSHFVEADISLPVRKMQLHAFNMTAAVCTEDEAGLDQMGLLIASRMTDRFQLSRPAGGNLVLALIKEKQYPEVDIDTLRSTPTAIPQFTLQSTPDKARIKWFVEMVNQCYPAQVYPGEFRCPGKMVDMVAAGDYHLLLAEGSDGEIGGGLAWKWEGEKTVEFFGPYIFHGDTTPEMACELLESCIGHIARSSALVLVNRMPTAQLPEGYLESLSPRRGPGPETASQDGACFRLMNEDAGAVVWSHPDLTDFLQSEYQRLVFPRNIRSSASAGEVQETFSVLSAEMDRRLGRAVLRPIWPGTDGAQNLAGHVDLLRQEGFTTITFEMDLGVAWQSEFTPGLLKLGFKPHMILPYAGAADLVIFALETEAP